MFGKFITACVVLFAVVNCYAVSAGDSYGGGTVFCVSKTPDIKNCITTGSGKYGLIMANVDQANFEINHPDKGVSWSKEYSPTGAQSKDDGYSNTKAILQARPNDDASNNAAWLCHNYRDLEGHTDWYLPSKSELNKMYHYAKARKLIGKNCTGSKDNGEQCLIGGCCDRDLVYWSSTESVDGSYYSAWFLWFSDGSMNNEAWNGKSECFGVRAIRVFSPLTIKPSEKNDL